MQELLSFGGARKNDVVRTRRVLTSSGAGISENFPIYERLRVESAVRFLSGMKCYKQVQFMINVFSFFFQSLRLSALHTKKICFVWTFFTSNFIDILKIGIY